jgi:ribosomal protein L19E
VTELVENKTKLDEAIAHAEAATGQGDNESSSDEEEEEEDEEEGGKGKKRGTTANMDQQSLYAEKIRMIRAHLRLLSTQMVKDASAKPLRYAKEIENCLFQSAKVAE